MFVTTKYLIYFNYPQENQSASMMSACTWDYCDCLEANREDCSCNSFYTHVQMCPNKGAPDLDNWRKGLCGKYCTFCVVNVVEI